MKEDYKLLYQAILYAAVGVFLCTTLAILMLRYGIWLWNAFSEKTPPAIELTQKQTDDMCVKWWTETDITAAKKRVCGK
jgi:hypothetical protein